MLEKAKSYQFTLLYFRILQAEKNASGLQFCCLESLIYELHSCKVLEDPFATLWLERVGPIEVLRKENWCLRSKYLFQNTFTWMPKLWCGIAKRASIVTTQTNKMIWRTIFIKHFLKQPVFLKHTYKRKTSPEQHADAFWASRGLYSFTFYF